MAMVRFTAVLVLSVVAVLALFAPAAAAGLRGSAFVSALAPHKSCTSLYMGSLQNAPNHAGVINGVPVGTAKQRKQANIKIEAAQKIAVEANRAAKAERVAARAAREAEADKKMAEKMAAKGL